MTDSAHDIVIQPGCWWVRRCLVLQQNLGVTAANGEVVWGKEIWTSFLDALYKCAFMHLSIYVLVYLCIYVLMYRFIYVFIYLFIDVFMYLSMYVFMYYVSIDLCIDVFMYLWIDVLMYVSIYVFMYFVFPHLPGEGC